MFQGPPAMRICAAAVLAAVLLSGGTSAAEEIRFYGDSVMFSTNSIIDNLKESREHTVFMKALRSVGLVQSLANKGPFTLFAPENEAFAKLPADFSESIFRRVNRGEMARLLACHIVAENSLAGERLLSRLKSGGPLTLRTLGGCMLILEHKDGMVSVSDESGNRAKIVEGDILQTNGVMQLIDTVLIPNP
jgi:uncharacterized surface protein with fasciclin (FAS1) repeats